MTRLERHYRKMNIGETVYVNIINGTEKEVEFLKSAIQKKDLQPVISELEKFRINDFSVFMNGSQIMPQMEYIKVK